MILAALSVVYISTEEFAEAQSAGLARSYNVQSSSDDASNGRKLGDSLVNGLVIVSVICVMTFGIVLLYKYRCMKLLIGYMILSSMMLLFYLCSIMLRVAIDRYEIHMDQFSFWFFLYNFAIVGTASIFYSQPFPSYITQAYLILTSVIVAWQLSFFDPWTAWVLLVLLALYDLFAVLTPCGPLKALVQLMSRENAPTMPGLLFEASLPGHAQRRRRNETPAASSTTEATERDAEVPSSGEEEADSQESTPRIVGEAAPIAEPQTEPEEPIEQPVIPSGTVVTRIPLALAKLYKLPLLHNHNPPWRTRQPDDPPLQFSSAQLHSMVEALLPVHGGRIVVAEDQRRGPETRYTILNPDGSLRRTLWLNAEGRVYEDLETDEDEAKDNSIKLGLGDFIFYSILVAKAALYSFTSFAACTVAIVTGLGMTLLLLAIRGHALPALPISIFLGVAFYLVTRYAIQPFIETMYIEEVYV